MCFACNIRILIGIVRHRSLVDLRLGFLSESEFPSMTELLGILSVCPELRALGLWGTWLWEFEEYDSSPVILKTLELLDLPGLWDRGVAILLPILSFGRGEMSVKTRNPRRRMNGPFNSIPSLLTCANVVRLWIQAHGHEDVALCLYDARDLRVLVLEALPDPRYPAPESILFPPRPCSAICPELQSLSWIQGHFTRNAVRAVFEAHSIQSLTFGACYMDDTVLEWLEPRVKVVNQLNSMLDQNRHLCMT